MIMLQCDSCSIEFDSLTGHSKLDNIILADVATHLLNCAQCAPRTRDIIIVHMAYTADHTQSIPFCGKCVPIREMTKHDFVVCRGWLKRQKKNTLWSGFGARRLRGHGGVYSVSVSIADADADLVRRRFGAVRPGSGVHHRGHARRSTPCTVQLGRAAVQCRCRAAFAVPHRQRQIQGDCTGGHRPWRTDGKRVTRE